MNNPSYLDAVKRLNEHSIPYEVLHTGDDSLLLVIQHGGRILGPFASRQSSGMLWMNRAWASPDDWNTLMKDGYWNLGGERLCIAPELQYHVEERTKPSETYRLPASIDPGDYLLTRVDAHTAQLSADVVLKANNFKDGTQHLSVRRTVRAIPNPLRTLHTCSELMNGIDYFGYSHTVDLSMAKSSPIPSETWVIMQVPQEGTAIIPAKNNCQIGWYYRPDEKNLINSYPSAITAKMTNGHLFKIGFHAASWMGRSAYVRQLDDKRWSLMIRSNFSNPSSYYLEEPFTSPGETGYAFHLYNSAKSEERFGEIESQGLSIGGLSGKTHSTDEMATWYFCGDTQRLRSIAHVLLSVHTDDLQKLWP
ncbi:MAG: hypothetical protein PHH86_04915 [Sphaerochaetaceae bacterium]|nr:hypothetical protein [Sphaerochaetaceae bacterium]